MSEVSHWINSKNFLAEETLMCEGIKGTSVFNATILSLFQRICAANILNIKRGS